MSQKSVVKGKGLLIGLGIIGLILLVFLIKYVSSEGKSSEAGGEVEQEEEGGKVFILDQLGHVNAERDRLKVSFGPSYYAPTGLYVEEGQKIKVSLTEHDQFNQPHVIISPAVLMKHQEAVSDGTRLKEGEREITARETGILYLVNNSYETDTPPEVTIEGAHVLPTFERGKTTEEEWLASLEENKDAPAFELLSDQVLITAGMDHKDLVIDPEALLIKHDEAVDILARASGLDADDPDPVHQPTKFRYHFRHSDEDGVWMYAWLNHTGYHTQTLSNLLNVEEFTKDGWGPWHELGHVHQQGATTPSMFVEVTNNIFSMTVQREFDQPSRLEGDGIYKSAFAYLDRNGDDFAGLNDFERLVLPWQLQLTYGEDLFPSVYRIVRELDDGEIPGSDEEKFQTFMLWTSTAAEQNLIPFYERWGWTVEEETKQAIEDLGYPEVTAPIWWNRDSNNTIKVSDVTIASVIETVAAYEEEMSESVYTELAEQLAKVEEEEENVASIIKWLEEQQKAEEISDKMYEIVVSQLELMD